MKLTNRQKDDLESVKYFIPKVFNNVKITEEDERMFIENSERGLHKDKIDSQRITMNGFNALIEGKKWRGINIHEFYEPGILDGSTPYWVLLGGESNDKIMPRCVVNIIKKELFKGRDRDLIEKTYNLIKLT